MYQFQSHFFLLNKQFQFRNWNYPSIPIPELNRPRVCYEIKLSNEDNTDKAVYKQTAIA